MAAGVVLLQALGTVGFALLFVADVLPLEEPRAMRAGFAFGVVLSVVGAAAVLVVAARALLRGQAWSRSLLVVAQLMAIVIGAPMAQGGDWIGWLVVASGVGTLVLLLHPATTAALELDRRQR